MCVYIYIYIYIYILLKRNIVKVPSNHIYPIWWIFNQSKMATMQFSRFFMQNHLELLLICLELHNIDKNIFLIL